MNNDVKIAKVPKMQRKLFIKQVKTLFKEYLSSKYKDGFIPLVDAVTFWNYSLNSYSHIKKKVCKWKEGVLLEGDLIKLSDFIEITFHNVLEISSL